MPAYNRNPRPLESLSREELAARVYRLREAMTELELQAEYDRGPAFECLGSMRVALVHLEGRLRSMEDPHPVEA